MCEKEDCIYRQMMTCGTRMAVCMYAAIEKELRGCPVDKCDKYKKGKKIKPKLEQETMEIHWIYDLGEEDYGELEI